MRFQQPFGNPEGKVNSSPILPVKLHGFLNYLIGLLTYPSGKEGLKQLSRKDSVMYSPWIIKTLETAYFFSHSWAGIRNCIISSADSRHWSYCSIHTLKLSIPKDTFFTEIIDFCHLMCSHSQSILVFFLPAWLLWREPLIFAKIVL